MIKRNVSIWLKVLLGSSIALAAPADPPQVTSARQNAVASLRLQIDGIRLSPQLTVNEYIDQTQSADAITTLTGKAHALGGPRWIDEQTVQVKLELSGVDVLLELQSIAATHPEGPISPEVMAQRLRSLRNAHLIGTGTCVGDAPSLRPAGMSDAWINVPEAQREAAIAAARKDANDQLLHAVASLPLATGQTAGDLIARDPIRTNVYGWLDGKTPSDVRYTDDLGVQLEVSTSQADLIDRIVSAALAAGVTIDTQQVQSIQQKFDQKSLVAVGHATAVTPAAQHDATALLPDSPPTWTTQPIDAQGTSVKQKSPLLTKHAAEADATQALRAQILSLRLTSSRTIGDAAKTDGRIEAAISAALLRAHVYRVDSGPDGSWRVRITLDTRDLWEELKSAVGQ